MPDFYLLQRYRLVESSLRRSVGPSVVQFALGPQVGFSRSRLAAEGLVAALPVCVFAVASFCRVVRGSFGLARFPLRFPVRFAGDAAAPYGGA